MGSAECKVTVGEHELWTGRVVWDGGDGKPDLRDSLGRLLVVNKWGRLRAPLVGQNDRRNEVARAAQRVIAVVEAAGYPAFIVGGTLLGGVREGAILPHDDDADIAYLSPHSHPADIVQEGHRLDRLLRDAGLVAVRHSWSHVQVLTRAETGVTDFYVDIFTAFYKDGYFHEPIHMRNEGLDDAILPLGELSMHGITFPTPAKPEAWLAACYGDDWREPHPGFEFHTPAGTRRRFDSWFSSFNQHRHYWNELHADNEAPEASAFIRSCVETMQRVTPREILDVGSGAGADLAFYEARGWVVHPSDYSWFADSSKHEQFALVNMANYTEGWAYFSRVLADIASRGEEPPIVTLNHLLAGLDGQGRPTMLRAIAFLVRNGAEVIASDYSELGTYEFINPTSWHYPLAERIAEAARCNLKVEHLQSAQHEDADGKMRTVDIVKYKAAEAAKEE